MLANPMTQQKKSKKQKKKVNEDGSGSVTAHGYAYNRQDQRVSWTKEFASEAEAKEWARRRNATILSIIPKKGVDEAEKGANQQLSIQQLATISDEALDNAYHYGRSSPGNTFGWQANLKSAAYAKQVIDNGVTDIEAISDAIHKGWNVTAKAFVQNPDQFDDTEKLKAAGKLEAKLQQRAKLMNIGYNQLPDDEQEKDRVVARALLQAMKGQQGVSEGAKVDRMVSHIKSSEKKAGKSAKDAESIAWATANKRGYLDNKNKKKHVKEADQSVFEEENRFTLYINGKPQTHHATPEEARRFAETVKLKYPDVKIEIKQEMREEDMDSAAHNPSGAKFGGYYKGTQKGAPRAGQGFGSMEEGIGGNMTVRSDPLTKLKQHENIKLKQADRFKGNKNRNNLVKAEAAKNATVAKPPMATKNPVAKFAQSVAKGAGKHQANDFKSQIKGLDRKAKHKGKDKFGLGESPNFLSWAMTAGYNVIGNPRVYEDAKRIYNNLLNEDNSDLKPGQYYLWTVNFDDGSSKKIKVNDEKFDVTKYYAGKNQVVVNVDYNWEPHNG